MRHGADDPTLKPHEQILFTLDVAEEDFDRGWLTVVWHTPGSASSGRMAWFPVNDRGDLADVLAKQVDMSLLA